MKSGISPRRALAYRPLRSRRSHSSSGVATWTRKNAPPAAAVIARTSWRVWSNGAIGLQTATPPWREISAATQLAIYRISQEALTNVLRHSGATSTSVQLSLDGPDVRLTVTNPGAAPHDPAIVPGGGLLGMRERAELLGGSLRAERRPTGGFLVEARLPVGRPR